MRFSYFERNMDRLGNIWTEWECGCGSVSAPTQSHMAEKPTASPHLNEGWTFFVHYTNNKDKQLVAQAWQERLEMNPLTPSAPTCKSSVSDHRDLDWAWSDGWEGDEQLQGRRSPGAREWSTYTRSGLPPKAKHIQMLKQIYKSCHLLASKHSYLL